MPIASPLSSVTRLNATAKDLMIYLYELAPIDVDVLFVLMKSKKLMTAEEIAKKLNRDKTTVFKSLQKLVGLGICSKDTRSIKEGGYYHVYGVIDIETFKMVTEKRVKEIQESFDRILRKFEDDLNNALTSFYR